MSNTVKKEPSGRRKLLLKGTVPTGKENAYPSVSTRRRKLFSTDCEQRNERPIPKRRFSLTTDEQKNESAGSSHAPDTVGLSNGFLVKKTPFRVHCDQRNTEDATRKPLVQRRGLKHGTSCLELTSTRSRGEEGNKTSFALPTRKIKSPKDAQLRSQIPLLVDVKERQKRASSTSGPRSVARSKTRQDIGNNKAGKRSASVSRLPVRVRAPLRRSASEEITKIPSSKPSSEQSLPDDSLAKKPNVSLGIKTNTGVLRKTSVAARSVASLFNDRRSTRSNSLQSSSNTVGETSKGLHDKQLLADPAGASKVTRKKISFVDCDFSNNCGGKHSDSSLEKPLKTVKTDTPRVGVSNLHGHLDRQDSVVPETSNVTTPVQRDIVIPATASRKTVLVAQNDQNEIRISKWAYSKEYYHELFPSEMIHNTEYHEDIPIVELEKEKLSPLLSDQFLQGSVNCEQRNLVVSFLIHLSVHCHYPPFVIYQAVKLFDIIVDRVPVETINIQLTALAALWIVLKRQINIHKIPSATTVVAFANELYEGREDLLKSFERMILETVKFNLSFPDPFSLLAYHLINCNRHLVVAGEQMTIIYNSGCYVIDLTLVNEEFCRISSSLVAFTAAELVLGVALDNINAKARPRWTFWRIFLRGASSHCNRFQDEDITTLRVALMRRVLYSSAKQSVSRAVYKKYKRRKYGRISDTFLEQIKNISSTELLDC